MRGSAESPAIVRPADTIAQYICSSCGADRFCQCNAPAVSKSERAKAAILANPEKSDRAIADEIGVSDRTVNRARESTATHDAVDVPRTGLDGKVRRMPVRREKEDDKEETEDLEPSEPEEEEEDTDEIDAKSVRTAYFIRADEAIRFATNCVKLAGRFKLDKDAIGIARRAAASWQDAVSQLEELL